MSRCFPFPPPGFVPNDSLINSIEKERKKAKKEKKKEKWEKKRKNETSAEENGKRSDKKHKSKKSKLHENSQIDKKAGNDPASAGEGSGTTEEKGLPAIQYIGSSPDDSQDSSKRRKTDNTDISKNSLANGLRIRLPLVKINESTTPASNKQLDARPALPTVSDLSSLTTRQSQPPAVGLGHRETPIPISKKPEPSIPTAKKLEPAVQALGHTRTPVQTSRSLNPQAIKKAQPSGAVIKQPKNPAAVSRPERPTNFVKQPTQTHAPAIKRPELSKAIVKHPEEHAVAVKKQNRPAIVSVQSGISLDVANEHNRTTTPAIKPPGLPFLPSKQPDHHIPTSKQQKQPTRAVDFSSVRPASGEPCFSGITDSGLQKKECLMPAPIIRHAESHPVSNEPCFSGRTEAAAPHKGSVHPSKPQATLGFSGSSSSRRKEAKFQAVVENWTPLPLQMELPQDDLDWLSVSDNKHLHKSGTTCRTDGGSPPGGQDSLSSWPLRAHHLPEANIYILPYALPF